MLENPASQAILQQRREMIENLQRRGIQDTEVLRAMETVRREAFLPPDLQEAAYADCALPIGEEQTISQPLIVGLMTQAADLSPEDRVLEIGTGSGYGAAVLAQLAKEVYTIERRETLARKAAQTLREQGVRNVRVGYGDGTLGWSKHAPFDAILVTAGGPKVPEALVAQLQVGGRLVMPVGEDRRSQRLVRLRKNEMNRMEREELGGARFVPLIGAQGWPSEVSS